MNKKFKTLLMAGLVTTLATSSVVSSSAISKDTVSNTKTKGAIYLCINGVKYKIPFLCNGKPSIDEDNNANNDNNNGSQEDNNANNDNNNESQEDNNANNDNNNGSQEDNNVNNDNNNESQEDNNTNNDNENNGDSTVETPDNDNNSSGENSSLNGEFSSFQQEVLRLVNVERSKVGLKELTLNTELSNVATLKSQDMANKNYFSHTSPTYGSPFDMMNQFNITYKTAGENIAKGQTTPAQVVEAWMNSEGHRANILSSKFSDLGVGVAKNSNGTIYWTQMFIGK